MGYSPIAHGVLLIQWLAKWDHGVTSVVSSPLPDAYGLLSALLWMLYYLSFLALEP